MNRQKYAKRLEPWRKVIKDCEASKLPVAVWCRQNGYLREQYNYYRKKILAFDQKEFDTGEPEETQSMDRPTPVLIIKYGDSQFNFYKDADPQTITATINTILNHVAGKEDQIASTKQETQPAATDTFSF